MLKNSKAFSGFAAPDIDAIRAFYGDTLGVEVTEENGNLTLHLDGGKRPTLVYPKPDHEPANYTILNFEVADIEATVDGLVERGVEFERYGAEFGQDERGIARDAGPRIAWFKDPAGNILSVIQTG
jgi:catechol 2,3-dioxygenase-like lactoylglutathione lyase family enzyme